jgi:hypothetical protein
MHCAAAGTTVGSASPHRSSWLRLIALVQETAPAVIVTPCALMPTNSTRKGACTVKLVKDSDPGDESWRLVAAAQLRHVATALEVEQLPNLNPYAASTVQDMMAQLRRNADELMTDEQ